MYEPWVLAHRPLRRTYLVVLEEEFQSEVATAYVKVVGLHHSNMPREADGPESANWIAPKGLLNIEFRFGGYYCEIDIIVMCSSPPTVPTV